MWQVVTIPGRVELVTNICIICPTINSCLINTSEMDRRMDQNNFHSAFYCADYAFEVLCSVLGTPF